jgi:hypothetical protein
MFYVRADMWTFYARVGPVHGTSATILVVANVGFAFNKGAFWQADDDKAEVYYAQ